MIITEAYKLKSLLDSFLGESKNDLDETYQLQYPCPKCVANKGTKEIRKYNLEVNILKGVYSAWCCSQYDDEMHGSIMKLIKLFGNENILLEYKKTVYELQQSSLYKLSFNKEDFKIDFNVAERKEVELPSNFKLFNENEKNPKQALDYLFSRGITWDIIKKFHLGYTTFDKNALQTSLRIIIPSFNAYGELNFWVGRDYTNWKNRMKYLNPKIEKKDIIFNEEKIEWDADVTLVEGPFDHLVVPNSIPLLGKSLKSNDKLFYILREKCNANINIWLDSDALNDVKEMYRTLNHDKLYNRVFFISNKEDKDPSLIYEKYGNKGIIEHLKNVKQFKEIY